MLPKCAIVFLLATQAAAVTYVHNFTAVADATICRSSENSQQIGSSSFDELAVGSLSQNEPQIARTLIRFELSNISYPTFVSQVTLNLPAVTFLGEEQSLQLHQLLSSEWQEVRDQSSEVCDTVSSGGPSWSFQSLGQPESWDGSNFALKPLATSDVSSTTDSVALNGTALDDIVKSILESGNTTLDVVLMLTPETSSKVQSLVFPSKESNSTEKPFLQVIVEKPSDGGASSTGIAFGMLGLIGVYHLLLIIPCICCGKNKKSQFDSNDASTSLDRPLALSEVTK